MKENVSGCFFSEHSVYLRQISKVVFDRLSLVAFDLRLVNQYTVIRYVSISVENQKILSVCLINELFNTN